MSEKMIEYNLELIGRVGKKDIMITERIKFLKSLRCDKQMDKHMSACCKSIIDEEISFLLRLLNI